MKFTHHLVSLLPAKNGGVDLSPCGVAGLYIFALGAYVSPPLSATGVALMFVAFIWQIPASRALWQDRMVVLSLIFAFYLIARTFAAAFEFPQTWAYQIERAFDLFQLGFLYAVVIAYWVSDNPRRVYPVFLLALCGLVIRIILKIDITNLRAYLLNRPGFGMPANAFGLYASVALLGILLFAWSMWGGRQQTKQVVLGLFIWLVLGLILLQGLVFSQSMSAYLATLIVFPPLFFIKLFAFYKTAAGRRRRAAMALFFLPLLVITLLVFANTEIIKNRILVLPAAVQMISANQTENLPGLTLKARYDAWRLAYTKWQERPLLGWGPGTPPLLLKDSAIKSIQIGAAGGRVMKDFHNSYLETLIQIGFVGSIFFIIFWWLVFKSLWQAHRSRWLDLNTVLFTLGALALFLITTAANLRTGDHLGRHHIALFCGIAYAYSFYQKRTAAKDSAPIRPQI